MRTALLRVEPLERSGSLALDLNKDSRAAANLCSNGVIDHDSPGSVRDGSP